MKTIIKKTVDAYISEFPEERSRLSQLESLIQEFPADAELIARDNHIGHVTASGFIISPCRTKVLMLLHKKLDMWIQPGGHIEKGDCDPLAAAVREVEEEIGLIKPDYLAYHHDDVIPIDIDSHQIPASGNHPLHFHHDFRYTFLSSVDLRVKLNQAEFNGFKWRSLSDLMRRDTYKLLKPKLERLLSGEFRPKLFFDRLFSGFEKRTCVDSLAVAHILPDTKAYFSALSKSPSSITIIPKPKSIDIEYRAEIEKLFPFIEKTREQLLSDSTVEGFIDNAKNSVVLFDIGGYFAPIANELKAKFSEKLLGIVEDTENGHQKYEAVSDLKLPVISVARSPLKENEDYLVGKSILFSTDAVLRELGKVIEYLNCSVFGYGKIGSSIAHHLQLRGVKANVFDTNPMRRIIASNRLHSTIQRDQIISTSDVIFCATGSHVLDILDFRSLKPGCAIVSVTSSDDEMDLRHLKHEYQCESVSNHVARYSSTSNHFFLVNHGNAVNFLHKAALGDYIHLVRAEMCLAADKIAKGAFKPGLTELSASCRTRIATLWLETFIDEPAIAYGYSQAAISQALL